MGTKQKPKTDWVNISANGRPAEIARKYVKKGLKVLIEGFPTVTAYVNKDNQTVAIQNLYPLNIEILSGRNGDSSKDTAGHQYFEGTVELSVENAPTSKEIIV